MGRVSRQSLRHLLLCGFAICAPAYADITYDGSFTTASNTVNYSITTDGVLGVLASSDIVSVSFSDTGSNPFSPVVVSGFGSGDFVGSDLSATATTLVYNFNDSTPEHVIFCPSGCNPQIGFATAGDIGPSGAEGVVYNSGEENTVPNAPGQVIATATPEPGTLVPTLGLSMILGLAAWKRRRQARRS